MEHVGREGKAFCIECGDFSEYAAKRERIECEVRGVHFTCTEETAYCIKCGEAVYVPEINDRNARAREDAYRKAAGLISVEDIEWIQTKYNIGAEPLALVLGFGKVTINRYMGGQLPSKANSEKLFEVLRSRRKMSELLEEQKEKISDNAYRKCASKLNDLDMLNSRNKIEVVTRCLLKKAVDITPLALQKLLYYSQAFYRALFGKELFDDSCYAWVHGPVYPEVYHKYKAYGYDPIDTELMDIDDDSGVLDEDEIDLLNAVIKTFGRYSGKTLEAMIHLEEPWINARSGLGKNDRGYTLIAKDEINVYFRKKCQELDITMPGCLENYCNNALERIFEYA